MTDREHLDRFLNGDDSAFDALVEHHQTKLLRYAARQTGCLDLAQDVVQDTFVRLLKEAPRLEGVPQLDFWLLRVCRNLCTDAARKETRMHQRHLSVAVPDLVVESSELEQQETCSRVRTAFDGLPEAERELLVLKVYQGHSYREMARITGLTLHKVSSLVHRGLNRLSRQLRSSGVL